MYGLDWRDPASIGSIVDLPLAFKYCFGHGKSLHYYRKRFFPFRCYGDDLICDKRITSNVVDALQELGFSVNTEKSFYSDDAYRESCGGNYLHGDCVTPLKMRTKPLAPRVQIETLATYIDAANACREYGYMCLRRHIIQFCLYYPIVGIKHRQIDERNPILFVNEQDKDLSMSIICDIPHNNHLRKRFFGTAKNCTAEFFQRDECMSISIGPKSIRKLSRKFDNYHYTLWWASRYEKEEGSDLSESTSVLTADTLRTGAKWRWTPI
jgi:hypothetical protein